jgi:hypothetical protein
VLSENRKFTSDVNSETVSPRSTTNNTNINFYIQTAGSAGFSSERQLSEARQYQTSHLHHEREGTLTARKRKTHLIMPFERLGQQCHQKNPTSLMPAETDQRPRSAYKSSTQKSAFRIRSPEERMAMQENHGKPVKQQRNLMTRTAYGGQRGSVV